MNFKERMLRAWAGEQESIQYIFEMYRPLLVKEALVDKKFDEDLYQELCVMLLKCIQMFRTGG